MYQNLNVTDPSLAQLYLMLEQADFDISSLADITPAGRDDGCCVVNMDPDLMGSIVSADTCTYRMDDSGMYLLGNDDRVDVDMDEGTVSDTPATDWFTLNGHIISPTLYGHNDSYSLYAAPISIDGNKYALKFYQDYATKEISATGLAELTEDGKPDGLIALPQAGTDITVLDQRVESDGSITLVEGDTFELEGDVKIYPEELPKGNYQRSFLFHNPKGETAESGAVPFTIE